MTEIISTTKIYVDAADFASINTYAESRMISGFTTNPTLLRNAGVVDYESYARELLKLIPPLPISFEVIADEIPNMIKQGMLISSWGSNVYVKIPVVNSRGESTCGVIRQLSDAGVKVNVTAVMTVEQVEDIRVALTNSPAANVSIFAGRIADTGRDPLVTIRQSLDILRGLPHVELIWASPRQIFNLIEAERVGCHIITLTPQLLQKISLIGKDLSLYSQETVKMFVDDSHAAGLSLGGQQLDPIIEDLSEDQTFPIS